MQNIFWLSMHAQAQTIATEAAGAPAPVWMQFVPFVIIIAVFYFFLIRPQAQKQKETQTLDDFQFFRVT